MSYSNLLLNESDEMIDNDSLEASNEECYLGDRKIDRPSHDGWEAASFAKEDFATAGDGIYHPRMIPPFPKDTSGFDPHGVCKELVFALREALDKEGFNYVKIIVSSSFGPEKIKEWKALGVPVDLYGVGTYFVNNMTCGFTGDLVMLDGKPQAKEGRANYPSNRLQKVKYPIY